MAPDYDCWYQYVIVRKDMPKHYHIIQTAHAVQHATLDIHDMDVEAAKSLPIHLILLEAKSEDELMYIANWAEISDIKSYPFHEPDYDTGNTAVAFQLLKRDDTRREFFKKFRMYK